VYGASSDQQNTEISGCVFLERLQTDTQWVREIVAGEPEWEGIPGEQKVNAKCHGHPKKAYRKKNLSLGKDTFMT